MKTSKNTTNRRSYLLAERLMLGADKLYKLASKLSDEEWEKPVIGDGRAIGVVVHHVASVYPLEIEMAQMLASRKPITEATLDVVNKMNADHALAYANAGKKETLELLNRNSSKASKSVRTFTDQDLDSSATVSLNADAPLTAQFFIEDHALRHSFHHLAKIKASLI